MLNCTRQRDKETLYLIHINEVNEDAFKVVKAGKYFMLTQKLCLILWV